MNNDVDFMKLALVEAKKAFDNDEVPVGAVLVCGNEVIGTGFNTREKENNIAGHAEINCLLAASKKIKTWKLSDCVMYVTLEPCPMCASALQQARIKRIVYGAYDVKNGACGGLFDFFLTAKLNHYPLLTSGVLQKECEDLLKLYFKNKR